MYHWWWLGRIQYCLSPVQRKKEGYSPWEKILDCRSLGGCLPKALSFLDDKIRAIAVGGFIGTTQEFCVEHSE